LLDIFPKFVPFAILATVVGLGGIHVKRSHLYSSEVYVAIEANPYNYRMTPGKETVPNTPYLLIQLRILQSFAETHGLLTGPERAEIDQRGYVVDTS
jgi:hypothetical protein